MILEKNEFDNSFVENCNSSLVIQLRAQNQGMYFFKVQRQSPV